MLHEQRTIEHHWHQQSCLIYCFQLFWYDFLCLYTDYTLALAPFCNAVQNQRQKAWKPPNRYIFNVQSNEDHFMCLRWDLTHKFVNLHLIDCLAITGTADVIRWLQLEDIFEILHPRNNSKISKPGFLKLLIKDGRFVKFSGGVGEWPN